jgi:addiction module RelE/StbE family toxin
MKKYSVHISEPAKQDIIDIVRYISAELNSSQAAIELLDTLDIGTKSLDTNPKRNAFVRDERLAAKGYRALFIKNYIVFYKVDEKAKNVDIIRILYGRRDWAELLF